MTWMPKRIGWVVYGELEQVTGGYIYDRLVVERLRELGDSVTVVSLTPGASELPSLSDELDALVGDELCFRELLPLFQRAPAGLRRVLLIHHLSAWEHPLGAERAATLALEKAVIDAADACVTTSHVTADRLHAEGLSGRVSVAEPGADRLPRSDTGGQEPSGLRLRLLFLGNILRRKRVLELVQAFARLPAAHVELVLVGAELEPDYAAEVRRLIAASGVASRVHWMGSLPVEAVAEQLTLADALVLPSALEGYGMVLSEALWSAVPVIAARVGAAEKLVTETGAGLLFEPSDDAALGATLGAFIGDAALRLRLRRAAWNAAEILPRWRDTALAVRSALAPVR
jgi:glycosyltransferase involved in cell wall biosynthesis